MALTYSPASNLIKRDGVVIGAIKKIKTKFVFTHYKFNGRIECNAATVEELLPKIKKALGET